MILISHNMPHVFEVADRIHIHRLGRRIAVVTPKTHTMNEAVAIMTGATEPGAVGYDQVVQAGGGQARRRRDGQGPEGLRAVIATGRGEPSPRPQQSGTVSTMLPERTPRRPTMRDVAALAGVSLSTVSRVVSGSQQVDPELAVKVDKAVEMLGYRHNSAAATCAAPTACRPASG